MPSNGVVQSRLGVLSNRWPQVLIAALSAIALPAVVAWVAVCARGETSHFTIAHHNIPVFISESAKNDWPVLTTAEEQQWFGVALTKYSPGAVPDCSECDVAVWHIRSGWPLRCLQAVVTQDTRRDRLVPKSEYSPFSDEINNPEMTQLHRSRSSEASRSLGDGDSSSSFRSAMRFVRRGIWAPSDKQHAPSLKWQPLMPITWQYLANVILYTIFLLTLWWVIYRIKTLCVRHIRARRGECVSCGYSLCHPPKKLCPECGLQAVAGGTDQAGVTDHPSP